MVSVPAVRIHHLHPFTYIPREPLPDCLWKFSTADQLFSRWGCSKERLRVSLVNKGFKVCASYPQEVIVPVAISDEEIKKVSVPLSKEVCH